MPSYYKYFLILINVANLLCVTDGCIVQTVGRIWYTHTFIKSLEWVGKIAYSIDHCFFIGFAACAKWPEYFISSLSIPTSGNTPTTAPTSLTQTSTLPTQTWLFSNFYIITPRTSTIACQNRYNSLFKI